MSLAFNDARRLDRQLAGRAGRQGDPGSYQQFLCLNDPYLMEPMPAVVSKFSKVCLEKAWSRPVMLMIRFSQLRMEWRHSKERLSLYRSREKLEQHLAFSGQQDHLS